MRRPVVTAVLRALSRKLPYPGGLTPGTSTPCVAIMIPPVFSGQECKDQSCHGPQWGWEGNDEEMVGGGGGAAGLEGLVLQGYKNIQGAFPLCQASFSTLYLVLTVSLGRRQTHYSCFIDEPHL